MYRPLTFDSARSTLLSVFLGVILGILIGITTSSVIAWTTPTATPPNGNVSAPITTGGGQIKLGGLALNQTGFSTVGLIVGNGGVAVGTSTLPAVFAGKGVRVDGKIASRGYCDVNGENCFTAEEVRALLDGGAEPEPVLTYTWNVSERWDYCNNNCGSGIQSRAVWCTNSDGDLATDADCVDAGPKPATSQSCYDDSGCPSCTPNAYEACYSGDLYNYDSCGNRGSRAQSCTYGCGVRSDNGDSECLATKSLYRCYKSGDDHMTYYTSSCDIGWSREPGSWTVLSREYEGSTEFMSCYHAGESDHMTSTNCAGEKAGHNGLKYQKDFTLGYYFPPSKRTNVKSSYPRYDAVYRCFKEINRIVGQDHLDTDSPSGECSPAGYASEGVSFYAW